jgi:ADP-heptose:LPS heptosyltransferase
LVGLADVAVSRSAGEHAADSGVRATVLLLRLERIGDLLMVLDAIRDARALWPDAEIDVAVGSWNASLAALIPEITRTEVMDVPWLARHEVGASWPAMLAQARGWRRRGYDLVQLRAGHSCNLLGWLSGAPSRRVLLRAAAGRLPPTQRRTARDHLAEPGVDRARRRRIPPVSHARRKAGSTVPPVDAVDSPHGARHDEAPLIGCASGGRAKQWHVDRFATVARHLAKERGARSC